MGYVKVALRRYKYMDNIWPNASSVSNNDIDSDAALNLRTEDLNWQGEQFTSLCDRFQIHMFTEEFEQNEQNVREMERENKVIIFGNVMYQEAANSNETEQIFETIMNAETEKVIKADYITGSKSNFDFSVFFYISGGIAIAGLVLLLFGQRRKRK